MATSASPRECEHSVFPYSLCTTLDRTIVFNIKAVGLGLTVATVLISLAAIIYARTARDRGKPATAYTFKIACVSLLLHTLNGARITASLLPETVPPGLIVFLWSLFLLTGTMIVHEFCARIMLFFARSASEIVLPRFTQQLVSLFRIHEKTERNHNGGKKSANNKMLRKRVFLAVSNLATVSLMVASLIVPAQSIPLTVFVYACVAIPTVLAPLLAVTFATLHYYALWEADFCAFKRGNGILASRSFRDNIALIARALRAVKLTLWSGAVVVALHALVMFSYALLAHTIVRVDALAYACLAWTDAALAVICIVSAAVAWMPDLPLSLSAAEAGSNDTLVAADSPMSTLEFIGALDKGNTKSSEADLIASTAKLARTDTGELEKSLGDLK